MINIAIFTLALLAFSAYCVDPCDKCVYITYLDVKPTMINEAKDILKTYQQKSSSAKRLQSNVFQAYGSLYEN
jgi:hypothetical protein